MLPIVKREQIKLVRSQIIVSHEYRNSTKHFQCICNFIYNFVEFGWLMLVILCSIVGAIMVILGLYLLLWAKSNEMKKKELAIDGLVYPPLIQHETEVHEIMV